MAKAPNKEIQEIEETQDALRESIEQAKELAHEASDLLQKRKKAIENPPKDS